MGQGLSCRDCADGDRRFLDAVGNENVDLVTALVAEDPTLLERRAGNGRHHAVHLAAATGSIEVLSLILDRSANPDITNGRKQTPLMLAAMHGKISCVQKLLEAGANVLMFDSRHGRTCLHYAAYYGHSDCLEAILSAAHSSQIADSWGFSRFVNVRDGKGATPLHLAARRRRSDCVHILLSRGALVCASTAGYGYPGSSALHLAARGGCLDSVRELLAWGADRRHRDSSGRIPYMVAMKYKHGACAALLNPSAAEPLVWPSLLTFISTLNPEAKSLLENALIVANKKREKAILKGTIYHLPSPLHSDAGLDDDASEDSEAGLCCICFDQVCTIEVQECGHQMCAHCTLALCCHNKPNTATASHTVPVCPFCRSVITRLLVIQIKTKDDEAEELVMSPTKPRKSREGRNLCEGSSSFKSLSAMGSFGKMGGCNPRKVTAECDEGVDKP